MRCGSPHPDDQSLRCEDEDDNHPLHHAFDQKAWEQATWPNPDYRAPAAPGRVGRHRRLEQMNSISSRTRLRDRALARGTDPETSHEAASRLGDLTDTQEEVFGLVARHGPLTDEQLLARAADAGSTQKPSGLRTRRKELVDAELVCWDGWALNADGHRVRLWRAVEAP